MVLRAPTVIKRSTDDIEKDLNFIWCGSYKSGVGPYTPRCFDEAKDELEAMGLKIKAFMTYQYEEDFSDAIILCPQYDRKIHSSRIYYRLVLPSSWSSDRNQCDFQAGDEVVVLFTSFAGTDPHKLLLESCKERNI